MWRVIYLPLRGEAVSLSLQWYGLDEALGYVAALRRTFPEARYFVVREDEVRLFARAE